MVMRGIAAEQRLSQPFPSTVDLSTIFNVDTFLAALKLIAARQYSDDGVSTTEIAMELRRAGTAAQRNDLNSIVIAPLIIEGGLNFDGKTGMLTRVVRGGVGGRGGPAAENKATITPELVLVLSRTKSPAVNYENDSEDEEQNVHGAGDGGANECTVPLYSNGNRDKLICSFKLQIESNLSSLAAYSSLALIIPDLPQG